MDYSRFINETSKSRFPSGIRKAAVMVKKNKENIAFAAGMPNSTTFPFAGFDIKLKNGKILSLNQSRVQRALQYSENTGIPELREWFLKLQCDQHSLPEEIFKCDNVGLYKEMRALSIVAGSQDGLCKIIEMCVSRGDGVLCADYTYPGFLMNVKPHGASCVSIKSDDDGVRPDDLEKVLEDIKVKGEIKPRLIYLNPSGANPTGQTIPIERKKKIYSICRIHDILILEDDPYYYLQFNNNLAKSFLSLDVDGRVIRLDSMSKILSAGIRIGIMTGPAVLLEKIQLHTMCSVIQPASLSQVITLEILENMGYLEFLAHTRRAAQFYEAKMKLITAAAELFLKDLCEWNQPTCGMYLWIKVKKVKNTKELCEEFTPKHNVILVAGECFTANEEVSPCARISYSCVSDEKLFEGIKRLAHSIKEYLIAKKL